MDLRMLLAAGATLLLPLGAVPETPFTSLHPEEAHPDSSEAVSPDPYTGFIKQVQQKLHAHGFNAGPINGDFGSKTQAALAQFQLSTALPASGQLDDQTLAELGVERAAQASAGGSAETSAAPLPQVPADRPASAPAGPPSERVAEPAQGRELGGSCDRLLGPEKDRCLQQGGSVEVGGKSSSGASSPASGQ